MAAPGRNPCALPFDPVSTWGRIQAALRREKADLQEAVEEFQTRAHGVLDQKERELKATPAEKLASEQKRTAQIDDELDAVRKRIEGGHGR